MILFYLVIAHQVLWNNKEYTIIVFKGFSLSIYDFLSWVLCVSPQRALSHYDSIFKWNEFQDPLKFGPISVHCQAKSNIGSHFPCTREVKQSVGKHWSKKAREERSIKLKLLWRGGQRNGLCSICFMRGLPPHTHTHARTHKRSQMSVIVLIFTAMETSVPHSFLSHIKSWHPHTFSIKNNDTSRASGFRQTTKPCMSINYQTVAQTCHGETPFPQYPLTHLSFLPLLLSVLLFLIICN